MRAPHLAEKELLEERKSYHAAVEGKKENADQLKARDAKIRALMAEVSAIYSDGATPCPSCKQKPHGMKVRRGTYAVGCLGKCNLHAQGETTGEAVDNWNKKVYYVKPAEKSAVEKG